MLATGLLLAAGLGAPAAGPDDGFSHGFADSNGASIHHATAGSGPLVVMIHGFPDYWYIWRKQMTALQDRFQVVAIDLRGFNRSDAPAGDDNDAMSVLVADVIRLFDRDTATVVGHDWGGVVAWSFAFALPELLDNLIALNLPQPNGWQQSWLDNPQALAGTEYARRFVDGTPVTPGMFFSGAVTAENMAGWVTDKTAVAGYIEAFRRSDFNALLVYYEQNYPRDWEEGFEPGPAAAPIAVPTLVFHGLADTALHSDGLNSTRDWIDAYLTLVTVPGARHFVQQDAVELVNTTLRWWLLARTPGVPQ